MGSRKVSKQRVDHIATRLDELFPNPKPPLIHTDEFTLLVAVALSAQTTDKKVNEISPALFARAPNPAALAKLSVEEILKLIGQVNFAPQKAKNLSAMAKKLMNDFHGRVPRSFEELESLAGVGHKTASVVMSQAFGVPSFPVDTHIHRLAKHWGLSRGKDVREVEVDLKELFPEELWINLHLQIIYYGRQYCGARQCDGTRCEICAWCRAEDAVIKSTGLKNPRLKNFRQSRPSHSRPRSRS